jgi:hemolysin activation/secretion protein
MKKFFLVPVSAAALLLCLASSAEAAQAIPGSADSGRVKRQIDTPTLGGEGGVSGSITSSGTAGAPSGAENVKFKLVDVTIEKMTAYGESEVEPLYKDKVGTTISLADVYALANALTAKYRNDGFILTQVVVPPQTIENGRVRLRVVEGFAGNVRIEGQTGADISVLEPYAAKIRETRPFSAKALEHYLLVMNDIPGISAKAVLSPGQAQGSTDVTIIVDRKPFDVFFQVDNRGSKYIGPLQFNTGLRLNNMLGLYEGIDIQYATAPADTELQYGRIATTFPLNRKGTRIGFAGSFSRTAPGYTLVPFDVDGTARGLGVDITHPFKRSRNENLIGTARFDYLNSLRTDNTGGHRITDRIAALRLGGSYQNIDRYAGANGLFLEVSQGLSLFNAARKADPFTTRPGADGLFTKANVELSRLQRVAGPLDFFFSAAGQIANGRLLTSEQFGLGGAAFGSAYDSSEITGDDGVAARLEARLNNLFTYSWLQSGHVYGFYDIGRVWDPGNTVAADREDSLASAGAGYRFNLNENISGSFEAAKPLTRNVGAEGDRKTRLFGALTARF